MKKYILIVLFIGFTYVNAQTFLIGVVKDKFSFEELPYVSVSLGGKALCFTDERGCFKVKLPEKADSLSFSFVGYGRAGFLSNDFSIEDTNIILLQPNENSFNDVEVSAFITYDKTGRVGSTKRKSLGCFYVNTNSQEALFFSNEKYRKGIITKVGYYITDKGNPQTNFRVRIYKANKDLEPDGEILSKNIIVKDTLNGNNWVDVDLEKFRIKIPEYGFFVAMEWLPESGNYIYELKLDSQTIQYNGQVLGATSEFNKDLKWSINSKGEGRQVIRPEGIVFLNHLNPMIRAELKIK